MILTVEIKEGNVVQPGAKLFEIGSSKGFISKAMYL